MPALMLPLVPPLMLATMRITLGTLAALGLIEGAHAHSASPPAADSRITQVKVYPGSATVERSARVSAGSRAVTFTCLPAALDVQSLQVSADAGVRLGETAVSTEPRALSARCAGSALDGRIRALEEQKDALQSETDALALVTGYLKGVSTPGDDAAGKRAVLDPKQLVGVADALRRTGQDALLKQRQLARRQTELDRQLAPLLAERTRLQAAGDSVVAVTVTLASTTDAEIRLSYQIAGPGWSPTYRASLDTTTRKVRIERQALVAQATGEDWRGVKLLLSTGQPRRETTARLPPPWRIGIEPPPRPMAEAAVQMRDSSARMAMMAPAPATPMQKPGEPPRFDVSVVDNAFATEFSVPQAIDVPSGGQRVAVALGQHEDAVRLAVRASPRIDASAFLIADMPMPAGVWPAGAMQLYRDGAFVGNGQWNAMSDARLTLSFGRDELVRVQAEPERDSQASGGFVGSRAERTVQRAYVVENRHSTPISVQVIEAAPVSIDEQVRVPVKFAPQPAEAAWNKQPGVALWRLDVGAGQTARVAADYLISYPKEARLQER